MAGIPAPSSPVSAEPWRLLDEEAAEGDFAVATVETQKAAFERFGVWGTFDRPYLTLDPQYEAAQIRMFGKMVAGLSPPHTD